MTAEATGCFCIGQALWKWWTAVPIPEASDKQEKLSIPILPILPRQATDMQEEQQALPLLPILPRQVSCSTFEEDSEVNSPDLRAHRQRSPSWTMSPKKALPPRFWRCGSPHNCEGPLWWADLTPGGEDELDGMPRGRSRRSRSLTRPEDFVHFVRVMPVPVGFNLLQQKAFNDLSQASDLEEKVNKLDELNSLLQR